MRSLRTDTNAVSNKPCRRNSNDDKRKQSIDSIETYAYGTSKDLLSEEEG